MRLLRMLLVSSLCKCCLLNLMRAACTGLVYLEPPRTHVSCFFHTHTLSLPSRGSQSVIPSSWVLAHGPGWLLLLLLLRSAHGRGVLPNPQIVTDRASSVRKMSRCDVSTWSENKSLPRRSFAPFRPGLGWRDAFRESAVHASCVRKDGGGLRSRIHRPYPWYAKQAGHTVVEPKKDPECR